MYLPPLWRKIQVGVKSRGETTLGPLLRGGGGPREHGWTHRGRLRPHSRRLRSYSDPPSMRALYTVLQAGGGCAARAAEAVCDPIWACFRPCVRDPPPDPFGGV